MRSARKVSIRPDQDNVAADGAGFKPESPSLDELITAPEVAKLLGMPAKRLEYVIARGGPAPAGRVGGARVWTQSQIPDFRDAVASLRKYRKAGSK